MDTDDTRSNIRSLPTRPAGELAITIAEFDAQFDRDKVALIREATLDVEADLELLELTLQSLPPRVQTRLIKNRALHRALVLDRSPSADATTEEYFALINQLEMWAIAHDPGVTPNPPARGKKK